MLEIYENQRDISRFHSRVIDNFINSVELAHDVNSTKTALGIMVDLEIEDIHDLLERTFADYKILGLFKEYKDDIEQLIKHFCKKFNMEVPQFMAPYILNDPFLQNYQNIKNLTYDICYGIIIETIVMLRGDCFEETDYKDIFDYQ